MAETKKKQYNYTAVRIYEYTAAAAPVRTQGNGTPPGELRGGKTSLAGVTCTAVQQ